MNDDQMDEMLIEGVRDYNAPGSVPREEMWRAIRAARSAAGEGRRAKGEGRGAIRAWPIAVAAALILSVGVVIGRRIERSAPAVLPAVAVAPTVVKPAPASPRTNKDTTLQAIHNETLKTDKQVRELAAASPSTTRRSTEDQSLAYRLVVLKHLAGSEAMITSFRSGARSGEMDAQLATWSKELLGTTRLLESSQASDDPVMKRLLEDLDLVISQIVQYTARGTTNSDELDLIEQSIRKRDVMTELRHGVITTRNRTPAGTSVSGT
jgi:hypothetical protein